MNIETAKGMKDSANGPAYDYRPAFDGALFISAPAGECFKGVYADIDSQLTVTLLNGTACTLNMKAGGHIFLFFTAFQDVASGQCYGLL